MNLSKIDVITPTGINIGRVVFIMDQNINIHQLRQEFGKNKVIVPEYELPALLALSHYPELKDVHISIVHNTQQNVAYRTLPVHFSLFRPRSKRQYEIRILTHAKPPMQQALLKNCPFEAQVGVIGHELAHVAQFHSCGRLRLAAFLMKYLVKSGRKQIERGADQTTVLHELGPQLYQHAMYIRSIPGYIQENKSLDEDYLKPSEILVCMSNLNGT